MYKIALDPAHPFIMHFIVLCSAPTITPDLVMHKLEFLNICTHLTCYKNQPALLDPQKLCTNQPQEPDPTHHKL